MKSILIGATQSGAGKTTIMSGIMRALCQRGITVQPFKVGPDYIDPSWHQAATGKTSHNLDAFMLSDEQLKIIYKQRASCADINLIEGVMGLYDGVGLQADYCSSAAMAITLSCPVVLIVDGKSVATSLAATVQGFIQFDRRVNIVAVIINRVNSEGHYQLLKKAIEHYCNVPVIGRLPVNHGITLPERHLGLLPHRECEDDSVYWQKLVAMIEEYIDLDAFLALAKASDIIVPAFDYSLYPNLNGKIIAIAQDAAFHFYYQDNLELLSQLGAQLIPFSPLTDSKLPDCHAIYIGGGFPELYAETLAANQAMLAQLQKAYQAELPIYAECGGLMYLGHYLENSESKRFKMVGILPGYSVMSNGLKRFGYAQATAERHCLIARKGSQLRGHEFHHSQFFTDLSPCFTLYKVRDGEVMDQWSGGYQQGNTFASYLHLHFYQSPEILHCWLAGEHHV